MNKILKSTCRVCGKYASIKKSSKLFDKRNRELLWNLHGLSGLLLLEFECLPELICLSCESELQIATKLRERCILTQRKLLEALTEEQRNTIPDSYKTAVATDPKSVGVQIEEPEFLEEEITQMEEFVDLPADATIDSLIDVIEVDAEAEVEVEPVTETVGKGEEEPEFDMIIEDHQNEYEEIHMKIEALDEYKYNSDDEVAVLDNVLDDDFTEELPKIKVFPPHPKAKPNKESKRGPGVYICDQCGNHITGRTAFELHCRRHRGEKLYQCEICEDRFCTTSEMKRHMRKHTGERPFSCQYCGRSFTDWTTRHKHERTHTNERPYACQTCGKSFTTNYILKNHMVVHSGERAYKCNLCNKSFLLSSHLSTHYRSAVHKRYLEKQEQGVKLELAQPSN